MKHIHYLIFLTCLLFGLRANAKDSLDVEFIDKYYVTKPQQAYLLLKPTFERLQQEGWKKTTRQRYERVAGYVCLANNYYAKAMQDALNLEDLNKKGKTTSCSWKVSNCSAQSWMNSDNTSN